MHSLGAHLRKCARWLGAPRPQVVDSDHHQGLAADVQAMALVGEHAHPRLFERAGNPLDRRPMVVIAGDREDAQPRLECAYRLAKSCQVAAHRLGPGEIIAGQENEIRPLRVDRADGQHQAFEVFVAVDVQIAQLAGDHPLQRCRQAAHREPNARDVDFVERAAPDPMQRAQRDRRFGAAHPPRLLPGNLRPQCARGRISLCHNNTHTRIFHAGRESW